MFSIAQGQGARSDKMMLTANNRIGDESTLSISFLSYQPTEKKFSTAVWLCKSGSVYLAKIGTVKPICSRELPSIPSSVTIIKDSANRYFLSFVVEIEKQSAPPTKKTIGIDLGIKTFATFDTVEKINVPKPLNKNIKRLRKLQRNLSRKK